MPRLYIQYQNNSPVPIFTQNLPIPQGEEPVVADLVAAFQARPGSLLATTDSGLLTLHSSVDGPDIPGNTILIDIQQLVGSYEQPLIIKSKNDMEVESSSTTSDSSRSSINKKVIQIDSIDIHTEHLKRPELLAKLTDLVAQYRFVRLTSPAASGKSSLLMLYQHSLKKRTGVVWISCLDDRTCSELLREKAGIDLKNETTVDGVGKKDMIVFLDDAQAKYADITFWKLLVKMSPNWLPHNVRFVISSTHLLAGGIESPVELRSLPRLERSDFLLSTDESDQFLDFEVIGLPKSMKFPTLKTLLINECGGLIGALRLSVDSLKSRFSKDIGPSELALLQHFLSNDYVANMDRCFGSAHSAPIGDDFKQFLKRIFVNEKFNPQPLTIPEDKESYSSLQKAGILVELPDATTFMFSSLLAKRYYFKWIFPNRSLLMPSSLHELVRNVLASMSSNLLKHSTVAGDFPKEAVFQHLVMEGLAAFTPPSCCICPELSKIFFDGTKSNAQPTTVAGEIDFYLNSSLRWGIELLVNGDGIGEHVSRFTPPNGKYVALAVSDYTVVDFRRNSTGRPTNISRHPNRITVFFKEDDYSIAHCIFGQDSSIVQINLSN
jgi:hypothetical protein